MIYLDLFCGAGGGSLGIRNALRKKGIERHCKGAFEIDPDAIKIFSKHFISTPMMGDVGRFSDWKSFGEVHLIVGGSPCTDLSIIKNAGQGAGDKREHLKGKDSILFFKYVEAIEKLRPRWFLLENVSSMSKAAKDEISKILGVQPIEINSSLLSAQNRSRLYWCNWDVSMPENKFIQLNDIKLRCPFRFGHSWSKSTRRHKDGSRSYDERLRQDGKANCLTGSINGSEAMTFFTRKRLDFSPRKVFERKDLLPYNLKAGDWRPIFPTEAERLQTFPDGWTEGVSNTASYRLMGKAMTVDVIDHIISCNEDLR
tara:strand:- start:12924 stop:13862 length:939 start_codon:yes stop_codon:yes gene_type:complete